MAERILTSRVRVDATYNDIPTMLTSQEASVLLIEGLTVSYGSDKQTWADSGLLTYTVIISNNTDYPHVAPVIITDTFDTLLVSLVEGSVTVDDQPFTEYTYIGGVLKLRIPDVDVGETVVIRFQIQKI